VAENTSSPLPSRGRRRPDETAAIEGGDAASKNHVVELLDLVLLACALGAVRHVERADRDVTAAVDRDDQPRNRATSGSFGVRIFSANGAYGHDMEFTVVQGDIAAESADALVNAAGTSLRMGSGVAGALRRAANGPINEAAMAEGPIDLGEVAVTDAYDLDAEYVIHAAAMPHYGVHETPTESREPTRVSGSGVDGRATEESIREATRNALERADEVGCESVVVPVLGTGAAGFDLAEGARFVCEEIDRYEPAGLTDVRVIAYADSEYGTVREVAKRVRSA
jgi:O-acetyl-ADP-ribose deacetylase